MSQRISLTRIIALNWYGFRQIFDVTDNVLISGSFGTGKSALLDLLQYVLLGEHWRANRAAAGNARGRDLAGYCLGDTNQTQKNGQRHFLRSGGVTIAALEFSRPAALGVEPKRETWGIRVEYSSPDAAPKQTYFCIPERVDYTMLAPDGKMLAEDAFRSWLRREYGNDSLFARQGDYLEEMAAPRRLNFEAGAFHRTFPKAIAFEPEENVGKFIREFILEESPLDVRDVRMALRAYDDTRKRLEKQEDEAAFLRRIAEQHQIYETSRREEAILLHTVYTLRQWQAEEKRERHAAELKRLELEHADDLKALVKSQEEATGIDRLLNEVRFEIQKDPAQIEYDKLARQKRDLQLRVDMLREARKAAWQRLDERHYRWIQWLKHGHSLPIEGLDQALAVNDAHLMALRQGPDGERMAALPRLATRFNEMWSAVRDLLRPLDEEIRGAQHRLQQLAEDLENLNKGQAPGSFPLFQTLRQKLGNRVEQLGRLIEVRPEAERWWPALELFLGRNRWVLVVQEQADYREALEILRKTAPGREPESLLNPFEARQMRAGSRANSLFSKVEVAHPIARSYVEHLLGDVACVESVEELEKVDAGRAITPEGVFKQAPLRRRLKPAVNVDLTLGREGLERMRSAKQKEQVEIRTQHAALKQRLSDVEAWLDTGRKGGLADGTLPDRSAELEQLPAIEADLDRVRETINLLMTSEREERQKRYNQLEQQYKEALARIGMLNDRKNKFELTTRPEREGLERALEEASEARLEVEASRVELSKRFSGVLEGELTAVRNKLRADYPKWTDCVFQAQAQARKSGDRAVEARAQRKSEREHLSGARDEQGGLRHPEYQYDFPLDEETNSSWDDRLRVLETIELAKSRQLAADRKKDWERRLEENVLNELNGRINEAQNTIRLLDRYLSQPIGKFRYRISQRRDTAGYGAMWRLLDSGLEPSDPLTLAVKDGDIQRAKEELMLAVDAPDKGDDRVRRLLDYRNYHHYDLEMVPADKQDAPPISLARSGRNLSGGENQAPFFISMLAAFRRVYDRGDRGSQRSQQLGLVVMDEAFSKLSGDGIDDCLALARSFQLQLVMAFPPERLGVMVPHAQTVIMCQKFEERDADGYVRRIDNIPHLTTMAEAMSALE
ncbi:MAG TPA: SbcC/MukB-like Walker B domain-containing protein [Candidatus Limnocylindria bacterium]|nr:SbcC/MukB-like Walker B domain-containing protein [Candidatus Limnocylindria bacterium]